MGVSPWTECHHELIVPKAAPGREHYAEYEDLKLWRWCCEFAGRVPDIYDRNWDSSRRYDVLHYLLSATRRGELPSETDVMIARAFDDTGEPIGDQVTGSQGIPIRYLSPSEVHDIAQFLADIDAESIRTHYDPVRMESADVYKFHAFGADEEWLRIVGYFNEFKALITNAAKRGDIVLVIWN